MKTMKKLAAVLLAAAMALTLLTACGGGGGGGSTSGGDSMETVFNFTGEELTAELNKELSSNAVYDEYLGDRFAAAMNAAMDAGSQFEDSDEAEEVAEGILAAAGFVMLKWRQRLRPKVQRLGWLQAVWSQLLLTRDFLSMGKRSAMQVQSLKEMETIIWSLRLFSKT